jgi:[ribosomal protein S18]-alanine N-acetyltransferase
MRVALSRQRTTTPFKPYYYLEPMRVEDVPEVSQVEHRCFTNPWPQSAYRRELRNPEGNFYIVLRQRLRETSDDHPDEDGGTFSLIPRLFRSDPPRSDPIVGFAGMWIRAGEAHVTTIGVAPEHRRLGLGELLFVALVEESIARGVEWLTLEVRVSNHQAQALYEKYGLSKHGLRPRYYSDNGEDADIMWSPPLGDKEFVTRFTELRDALAERLLEQELIRPRSEHADSGH